MSVFEDPSSSHVLKLAQESFKQQSYATQLKNMLKKVSNELTNFLDNLTYIYKSNGVCFKITEYHGVLMRMLSPIQIMTEFQFVDNDGLYLPGYQSKARKAKEQLKQKYEVIERRMSRNRQIKNQDRIKKNVSRSKYYMREQQDHPRYRGQRKKPIKLQQQPQFEEIKEQKSQNLVKLEQKNKMSLTRIGRQPILGAKMEGKLCSWIREQVSQGKTICNIDIMDYAKRISNLNSFSGSSGWLKRFMNRNPEIKILLHQYRNSYMQQTRKLEGRINKIFLNDLNSIPNTSNNQQQVWYQAYDESNVYQNQQIQQHQFEQIQNQMQSNVQQQKSKISGKNESGIYEDEQIAQNSQYLSKSNSYRSHQQTSQKYKGSKNS